MKISHQFTHLKAASPTTTMKAIHDGVGDDSSSVDDEKKQSEGDVDVVQGGQTNNNHFYSSPKRGLLGSTSPDGHRTTTVSAAQYVVAELQKRANNPEYGRTSTVARMRHADVGETASHDQGIRYKFVSSEPDPDDKMKKEKQRRWKQKMRIAQEGQLKERMALDDNSIVSSQFNGNGILSCVLDNVEETKLFRQLTLCGGLADGGSDYEESEFGSSTTGTSFSEEDDDEYSGMRKTFPRGRRKRGRIRNNPSIDSSMEPSIETSVDSSVLKDRVDQARSRNRSGGNTTGGMEIDTKGGVHSSRIPPSSIRSDTTSEELGNGSDPHGFKVESKESKEVTFSSSALAYRPSPSTAVGPAPMNGSIVRTFIEDLKHNGETMIWHQDTSAMNPSTFVIYLKAGYRCPDGSHCGPRLVWSDSKKGQTYSVDVFDIRSLDRADVLQLGNFPYAIPGRSVCLNLTNDVFIFEAATEEDAWNFVRGVRWMVARLAYNLVVGNLDVSCELLDLGLVEDPADRSPRSAMEFDWSRAMDDVTDQMVETTLSLTMV